MLTDRQNNLFASIVETYIKTAVPVGSELLCERVQVGCSSATVRSEMSSLEKEGFLHQPFTSAGRVPTPIGYQYYVENILKPEKQLSKKDQATILKEITSKQKTKKVKEIARGLANCTGASVIVGFGPRETYYTGISNLFSNPEFTNHDLVYSISAIVDRLDEKMEILFHRKFDNIQLLIGENNPFHKECSLLVTMFRKQMIFGIFGPMRMDYQKNYSALSFILNYL